MTSYVTDGTVGEWAREKLDILFRYLSAYTTILRKYGFQDYYYVDAFAGQGRSELRSDQNSMADNSLLSRIAAFRIEDEAEAQFVDGSPLVALSIEHPFKKYIYIEKDPARVRRLEAIRDESLLRARIEILAGDANVELEKFVLNSNINWNRNRGVILLDPFGLHVPWSTIKTLAGTGALEVIVNFPVGMAIQRLLPRSGNFTDEQRSKLTEYFGSAEWEALLYEDKVDLFGETTRTKAGNSGDRLAMWYRDKLKDAFGHATMPRLITNRQGGHLYYLLHAGPNPTGVKIANEVLMKSAKRIR